MAPALPLLPLPRAPPLEASCTRPYFPSLLHLPPPPHLPAHCSSAIGGCGKQAGFRLTLTLRPNTTYDIILSSLSTTTTQVKLSATAQTGKLVPWPALAGSWLKPHQIPSLPFTTATFNVSSTVLELSVCMAVRVCSK